LDQPKTARLDRDLRADTTPRRPGGHLGLIGAFDHTVAKEVTLGGVSLVFQAELRRRWRSWLTIALLVSVVGGFVLAAAAAGRRTESAFPRFVAAHGFDVVVYANEPHPSIAKLPGVAFVTQLTSPYNGQPTCPCTRPINPSSFDVVSGTGRVPFRLVSGHLPDPSAPDQVLASFTLEKDYGVRLGTVIHVPFYASSQLAAISCVNFPGVVPGRNKPQRREER